jgi:hypothetical protein
MALGYVACDDALAPWDRRAPSPRAYETRAEYRRRLCRIASRYLPPDHELKHVLDERADNQETDRRLVSIFFPKILEAAKRSVKCVDTCPPGTLRRIAERDFGGREIVSYVGRRPFTDDYHAANRRVVQFADRQGNFAR